MLFSLLCFSLVGCSSDSAPDTQLNNDAVNSNEVEQVSWESFLASIQGEDIGYPGWSIYQENPTNDELAQYLQNAAVCQTDSSEEAFGETIWTLEMYVDAPPDNELDYDHLLSLRAGLHENLVRISGGNAFPDGIFYVEDSTLYWLVRSINDIGTSIDEAALSAYQDTIEEYIAEEQKECGNPAVTVELLSFKEQVDRSDIGVEVYTIGTVWTSDSPHELLRSMAGGAYFDSQLRLHPDGNSAMSTLLVIDNSPVGFLSWEALEEIESQNFNSSDELLNSIKDNRGWFKPKS